MVSDVQPDQLPNTLMIATAKFRIFSMAPLRFLLILGQHLSK